MVGTVEVGSLIDGKREDCLVRQGLKRCFGGEGAVFWKGTGDWVTVGCPPHRPRPITETDIGS
jgi:hypothetical protein